MSILAFTREQSRLVDQIAVAEYGFSGLVLMENAGRGVADVLCGLGIAGPVVICCGKGNNAGDGFVIARHLDLRGHAVRVLLWADPAELTGDAAANYQILSKTDVPIDVFGSSDDVPLLGTSSADANRAAQHCLCQAVAHRGKNYGPERLLDGASWIVDALLGTGARGEPRPPLDAVIDQLNAAAAPKLAIDLPSGLDCDTGRPAHTRSAPPKLARSSPPRRVFSPPQAAPYVGRLHVLDIGVPRKLIEQVAALAVPSPSGRGLG